MNILSNDVMVAALTLSRLSSPTPTIRKRTSYKPSERAILMATFENTSYPQQDHIKLLANLLHRTPRQIQVWFQNQRRKVAVRK
jgi:hypothetical protein